MKIDRRRRTELTHSRAVPLPMRWWSLCAMKNVRINWWSNHPPSPSSPVIFTDVVKWSIFRVWCWIRCGVARAVNWDLIWDSAYSKVLETPIHPWTALNLQPTIHYFVQSELTAICWTPKTKTIICSWRQTTTRQASIGSHERRTNEAINVAGVATNFMWNDK